MLIVSQRIATLRAQDTICPVIALPSRVPFYPEFRHAADGTCADDTFNLQI